jgi:dolichol kinase
VPLPSGQLAEISRKVLHVTSAIIPLAYLFIGREMMLWLLGACVAIAIVVEVLRQGSARLGVLFKRSVGFMVRATEWDRVTGATYVLIGALLSIWLFPKPVAIAVLLILAISDSAASLIGLRYGRSRFLGKSLAGSGAFFVTALIILWTALPASKEVGLLAAVAATIAEALPTLKLGRLELNDNLVVPLLTGATVCFVQALGPVA